MSLPFELVFLMEESESHVHVVTFWSNGMVKGDRRVRTGKDLNDYMKKQNPSP